MNGRGTAEPGTPLRDAAAGEMSRPAPPGAGGRDGISRPVTRSASPDMTEPEPEPEALMEPEPEPEALPGRPAPKQRPAPRLELEHEASSRPDVPNKASSDEPPGSRSSNTRLTFKFRDQELAREYVDDESKDGCTSCPPTCDNMTTFFKHMLRALFPFIYLIELSGRWAIRKWISSCSQEHSCCNERCVPCCERRCSCRRDNCCCCSRQPAAGAAGADPLRVSLSSGGTAVSDSEAVDTTDTCRLLPCFMDEPPQDHNQPAGQPELGTKKKRHCCRRCFVAPEQSAKWGPNKKLVTFRRMAECLGWLYYLNLVYVVLCHSKHFHSLVRDMLSSFGIHDTGLSDSLSKEWSFSRTLFGLDPAEVSMPENSETASSFVDPALSVMYYPVFTFMLLVVLHAHEETSYPRRQRIEYSVETDSILSFGVKLISMMAYDPDGDQKERLWWKEARSVFMTVIGSFLALLGLEVLLLYFINSAQLAAWEDPNANCPTSVPVVGLVSAIVAVLGWVATGCYTQSAGFGALEQSSELQPDLQPEPEPEPEGGAGGFSTPRPQNRVTSDSASLASRRVVGRAVSMMSFLLGVQVLSFGWTCFGEPEREPAGRNATNEPELEPPEEAWKFINEFGLLFPVYALVALLTGILLLTLTHSDLLRKTGKRKFGGVVGLGDRVEIGGDAKLKGKIGTVKGVPWDPSKPDTEMKQYKIRVPESAGQTLGIPRRDHRNDKLKKCKCSAGFQPPHQRSKCTGCGGISEEGTASYFRVPQGHYVVQLDAGAGETLEQLVDTPSRQHVWDPKMILVPEADIADVDWATTFKDVFADITGGELRKLSFESEKYSERYTRRFAELQCTPVENYHFQVFDSRSLDQLKEKFIQMQDSEKGKVRTAIIAAIYSSPSVEDVLTASAKNLSAKNLSAGLDTKMADILARATQSVQSGPEPGPEPEPEGEHDETLEEKLKKISDELLAVVAELADPKALKQVLRAHVPDSDVKDGPFFQHFKGSLIFEGRGAAARGTCVRTARYCCRRCCPSKRCCSGRVMQALEASTAAIAGQGAVCGAALGVILGDDEPNGQINGWPWFGLIAGYLVGVVIGLVVADKDPTANHLADHILKLQSTMDREAVTDPATRTSPPLFADRVGKMILYLSKARQYKRRVEWRARLWYISIAHAAIPFVYTFYKTIYWKATFYAFLYAIIAGPALIILRDHTRRHARDNQICAALRSFAAKTAIFILGIVPVIFVVAGLPGARSALGIPALPDATNLLHNGTNDHLDVCGQILDTQGECCCKSTQEIVDQVLRPQDLKLDSKHIGEPQDPTECKFSQFFTTQVHTDANSVAHPIRGIGQAVTPLSPNEADEWDNLHDTTEYGDKYGYKGPCYKYLGNITGHQCALACGEGTDEWEHCRHFIYGDDGNSGCHPGNPAEDGGIPMKSHEFCTAWCSTSAYCGTGKSYETDKADKPGWDCQNCTFWNEVPIEDDGRFKCRADFDVHGKPSRYQCTGIEADPSEAPGCRAVEPTAQICISQRFLEEQHAFANRLVQHRDDAKHVGVGDKPTISHWCNTTLKSAQCVYQVSQLGETACKIPIWVPWRDAFSLQDRDALGCLACGGKLETHLFTFWATTAFTFAVLSRLYRCYEDYYAQYHRMLYFIQLTPWSTMKHVYQDNVSKAVRQKHEHWGLLPTFDLDSTANIVAWNKLRLFLQTYELRSSRRLQVSVVYLFGSWVMICVYQAIKAWQHVGDEPIDIETVFVASTTLMLACGISSILFTGKWINDITQIGFPHVLRVKQAELLDKSSHYLVEHDFWNGTYLHSEQAGSRACVHHQHQYPTQDKYIGGVLDRHHSATEEGLVTLKVSQLRKRAAAQGHSQEKIDAALNSATPHTNLVRLIQNAQRTMDAELTKELQGRDFTRTDLEARALSEGVTPAVIDKIGDSAENDGDEVKETLIAVIVQAARLTSKHVVLGVEHTSQHPAYDKSDANFLRAVKQKVDQEKGEVNIESNMQVAPASDQTEGKDASPERTSSASREAARAAPAPAQAYAWLAARTQAPSSKQDDEMRTHCYRMLDNFIHTVQDEYRVGSRSHWGAEDRRTKLWFIVMGQNTIKGFAAALVSGVSPLILHIIDKSGVFDT